VRRQEISGMLTVRQGGGNGAERLRVHSGGEFGSCWFPCLNGEVFCSYSKCLNCALVEIVNL